MELGPDPEGQVREPVMGDVGRGVTEVLQVTVATVFIDNVRIECP